VPFLTKEKIRKIWEEDTGNDGRIILYMRQIIVYCFFEVRFCDAARLYDIESMGKIIIMG
jgi:hypothetical protein